MIVNGIQTLTNWLLVPAQWNEMMAIWLSKLPFSWIVIAQNISDPDLGGRVQRAWDHFIKTGQVWAMLIGFFLGYAIKSFTSFG
jgi:hypothetical protein